MIPPQSTTREQEMDIQNLVGCSPFNMRQVTLVNISTSYLGSKNGTKSNLPYYRKTFSITSTAKSLDLLRKNLQTAINKDIENVLKKYLERFFQPAITNIKNNLGKDAVNDEHIKDVCRKMLEEAKCLYRSNSSRDSSPYECSDSEASVLDGRIERYSPSRSKRKESDTDSETNRTHKRAKIRHTNDASHKLPIRREAPKWDSDRIKNSTLFIMGAKANKVLGYGQTRGRLYVRHPELVRYSGDQEDKEWLSSKNLMPASGGKAYLMILSDIRELTQSDDYRNSPNLQLGELKGFEVPSFLTNKIKAFMESVRTDKRSSVLEAFDFGNHSLTPPGLIMDSPSTNSDVMTLDPQSGNVHLPEPSPSSNHSILSGTINTSPRSILSPSTLMNATDGCVEPSMMVKNATQNGNALTTMLSRHFGTDSAGVF